MAEQSADGPMQGPIPPVFGFGDPVEADPKPISGRPRRLIVVAIVAGLAVAGIGVLLVVRSASEEHGTSPAPDNQVVESSAQSSQDSRTSGGSDPPTPGDVSSSGSVTLGSSGNETTGPAGLPGDGGELPGG